MTEPLEVLGLPAVICSSEMTRVIERARKLAQINSAVLITGESGVGKEIVARAIHHFSLRCSKPWVDVSCGALPEHLIESELFGYEKGAFSGAMGRKEGLFELAHQGTLFLDEVGELDSRMQVKLLRVLDCGQYFRLGATRRTTVDVRIVAATNRDLTAEVRQGAFRGDLYHRLAQLQIVVPPLRQRREDILPLCRFFMSRHHFEKDFTPPVVAALEHYSWPGNVRELRNVIVSACAVSEADELKLSDLPESLRGVACIPSTMDVRSLAQAVQDEDEDGACGEGLLQEAEKRLILDVLARMNGHQERAAKALGISSRTLSRKLRGYRVDVGTNPSLGSELMS